MLVTRYNPFREFERRFFESFPTADKEGSISTFSPKVNTREDESAYYVDVDVPGVKKEDITIDVKDGVLTISGERNFKEEVKEEDYYKVETSFGKFSRTFSLSENIDIENIKASNEHGVLEITLPKKAVVDTSKRIAIA